MKMRFQAIFGVITLLWTSTVETSKMNSLITLQVDSHNMFVRLPCVNVYNASLLKWIRYFAKMPRDSTYSRDNSLVITDLSYRDSGLYGCTVCNKSDCLQRNVTLEVLHMISDESMLNQSVVVNGEVEFDCKLKVEPNFSYSVEFYKYAISDRHDLKFISNLNMLDSVGTEPLKLSNVTMESTGWYTCIVNHEEFFRFGKSGDPYVINNYIAFKKAYLRVVEIADGFDVNQQISLSPLAIIGMLLVMLILLLIFVAMIFKLMKQKQKYYERWIKTITVIIPTVDTKTNALRMPIIKIEKKRSIEIMTESYELSPVQDYEFPIDWKWEFPREKLKLGKQLGAGAFGRVFMAEADGLVEEGIVTAVAVKMLKEEFTDNDVKDLVGELVILKMIGKHPNIINLLGSCAQEGLLYVIVELAAHGNLKDFLRRQILKSEEDNANSLTMVQLVSFALQIASGMQFISSMKLIHRDLAARNVLVGEGYIMKITDFGLARDIHDQEYYRKITSGKLPIRWMAPESIECGFFDAKSDVWSFGVLLWEIITFGRNPYGTTVVLEQFMEFLKRGNRLEKPSNCPDEMYRIMIKCWKFEPENRPTFEKLVSEIEIYFKKFSNVSLSYE